MSAVLKPSKSKSVKDRVSKEEWNLRVDLAAAYQIAAVFKWTDWIFTPSLARLAATRILINPYCLLFEESPPRTWSDRPYGKVRDDPSASATTGLLRITAACMKPGLGAVRAPPTRATASPCRR